LGCNRAHLLKFGLCDCAKSVDRLDSFYWWMLRVHDGLVVVGVEAPGSSGTVRLTVINRFMTFGR